MEGKLQKGTKSAKNLEAGHKDREVMRRANSRIRIAAKDRKDRKETEDELGSRVPGRFRADIGLFFCVLSRLLFLEDEDDDEYEDEIFSANRRIPLSWKWQGFQHGFGESLLQNAFHLVAFGLGKRQARRTG